jgi:putative transposase
MGNISLPLAARYLVWFVMSNHVHLLMTPHTKDGIGKVMQSLGRYYVQYFNYKYGRTGTLWEGRYRATVLDSEAYLLTCYRYIELNPVRAGMVRYPADYPWSSYRCHAQGKDDRLITVHDLYRALGANPKQRQEAYRSLFTHKIPQRTLAEIREATNKAWVLGSERFQKRVEQLTHSAARPRSRGGDRRSVAFKKSCNNRV